jgi:hypothetical protein
VAISGSGGNVEQLISKTEEYVQMARAMQWPEIEMLWKSIKNRQTPDWAPGKALEHLIVRAFELSGFDIEYPYTVSNEDGLIEQIDGFVYFNDLAFLIECKDTTKQDIEVLAKLKYKIDRRPPTTIAGVFICGTLTRQAVSLANYTTPQRITVWYLQDIEEAITQRDFKTMLIEKYRLLCRDGLLRKASETDGGQP